MKKLILLLTTLALLSGCSGADTGTMTEATQASSFELRNTAPGTAAATEPTPFTSASAAATPPATDAADGTAAAANTQEIALEPICQYPELPTGCEVTSLAMVLNFYRVGCDKCEIADNYLTKGDDLTGTPLDGLRSYLDRGIPLIVWGTQDCREGHYSVTWNVDGKDLTWFTPEHCMVLVGMDDSAVRVADPIYGNIISYERSVFESSYDSLFQQAVAICPDSAAE